MTFSLEPLSVMLYISFNYETCFQTVSKILVDQKGCLRGKANIQNY